MCVGLFFSLNWTHADEDLNKVLSFKKIYLEPATDNMKGVFRKTAEQALREVFDKNPRFELVDTQGQADGKIQVALEKKTSGIVVKLSMVLEPGEERFSSLTSTIPIDVQETDIRSAIKDLLKGSLRKIPFYGTITGRDKQQVVLDIGSMHGIKEGDIVQVERVDGIKRHPLLKTILDVRMAPVGTIEIDQVEDTIAFGKITTEAPGEKIQPLHKIASIQSRPKKEKPVEHKVSSRFNPEQDSPDKPKNGFLDLGIVVNSFSSSSSDGTYTYSGTAIAPGARLGAEIWLTKAWFLDFNLQSSTMGYSHSAATTSSSSTTTTNTSSTSYSSSTFSMAGNVGYRFVFDSKLYQDRTSYGGSIYSPQVYLKAGYASFNWNTAVNTTERLSPKSYSGLNFGIGGTLPLRALNYGLLVDVDFMLFPTLTETGYFTGADGTGSSSVVSAGIGGYYFLNNQVALRGKIIYDSYSTNFTDSGTSTQQKQLGFLPSILYYF